MVAVILAGYLAYRRISKLSRPSINHSSAQTAEQVWGESPLNDISTKEWSVFLAGEAKATEKPHAINERYRLAGTFITYDNRGKSLRTAIIDDLSSDTQKLIAQNERLDKYLVASIERERVFLKAGAEEAVLTLSFSKERSRPSDTDQEVDSKPSETIISENRFGKRVAENRWVLSREALTDYYNEMLDDPERIAAIYISLKPDYDQDSKIQGYNLDMVGENEFFEAVGLRQGDIIRKANSMNMSCQARGEYFLREFINNRLGAVVLDIDRENVRKKMIYLIR